MVQLRVTSGRPSTTVLALAAALASLADAGEMGAVLPAGLDLEATRPMHCQTTSPFSLARARLVHNNLGGLGPDDGEPVIEYEGMGTGKNGNPISLVVTNTSTYRVGKKQLGQQGLVDGAMGKLAVAAGTAVRLKFKFLDTFERKPVVLDSMILTFLDLEHKDEKDSRVSMAACGASGYYLSDNAAPPVKTTVGVLEDSPAMFCTTFISGASGGLEDDPVGPDVLSDAQKARGVSLQFLQKATIDLTLSVRGKDNGQDGSLFFFTGKTTVDNCVSPGTTSTTTKTTVTETTVTTTTTTDTTTTQTSTTLTSVTKTSTVTTTRTKTTTTVTLPSTSTRTTTGTTTTITRTSTRTTTTTVAKTLPPTLPPTTRPPPTTTVRTTTKAPITTRLTIVATTTKQPSTSTPWKPPPTTRASSDMSEFWNCYSGDMTLWAEEQRRFCCKKDNIGCDHHTRAPDSLFDCQADTDGWTFSWSDAKKAWCCEHKQKGCPTSVTSTTTTTVTRPHFNCQSGKAQWETEWSAEQKSYCCTMTGISCKDASTSTSTTQAATLPPVTQPPVITQPPVVTQQPQVAPTVPPSVPTTAAPAPLAPIYTAPPLPTLAPLPTLPPIPTLPPLLTLPPLMVEVASSTQVNVPAFDCQAGLTKWKLGWSDQKKDWCCAHESLGCFNCQEDSATWSAAQRAYCCHAGGIPCSQFDYSQKSESLRGSLAEQPRSPARSFYVPMAAGMGLAAAALAGMWSRARRSAAYRAIQLENPGAGGLLGSE